MSKQYLDFINYMHGLVSDNPSLTEVDVSDDPITEDMMLYLCDFIDRHPTVTHINVCNTSLNSKCIQILLERIQINEKIIGLDLSENKISGESVNAISRLLENNDTLELLYLEGTQINENDITEISKSMKNNNALLHFMVNEELNESQAMQGIRDVTDENNVRKALAILAFEVHYAEKNNKAKDEDLVWAVGVLLMRSLSKEIEFLELYYEYLKDKNNFNHNKINMYFLSSASLRRIQEIILAVDYSIESKEILFMGKDFRGYPIKILGGILSTNPGIRDLTLINVQLDSDNMEVLAEGLKDNEELESLDLSYNPLNSDAIEMVMEALKNAKNIQYLSLRGITLDDQAAGHIAKMLTSNTTLKALDLSKTKLSPKGLEILFKALDKNKTLKGLDLTDDKFKNQISRNNSVSGNACVNFSYANLNWKEHPAVNRLKRESKKYSIQLN